MARKKISLARAERNEEDVLNRLDSSMHFMDRRWNRRTAMAAFVTTVIVGGIQIPPSALDIECPVALQMKLVQLGIATPRSVIVLAKKVGASIPDGFEEYDIPTFMDLPVVEEDDYWFSAFLLIDDEPMVFVDELEDDETKGFLVSNEEDLDTEDEIDVLRHAGMTFSEISELHAHLS